MEKLRAFLKRKDIVFSAKRYFIDAMGAMAQGLFCTLLVGTILNTIGQQFHIGFLNAAIVTIGTGDGAVSYTIGGLCSAMVGPGMAVAIARALNAPPLVLFSLIPVGFATNYMGDAGGPLAVLFVAIVAAELGKAVSKETKIDILVTPIVTVLVGVGFAALIAAPVGTAASAVGQAIMWATELQPFFMGILVSVIIGIALTLLTLGVIFGGIHRIARVSGVVVPVMALGYIALALGVVLFNFRRLPEVVELIVANAFGWEQAMGGGVGAALMQGIKRGLFSNEAGMGSAPNVAATAHVSHPVKQGLIQTLGVFTDTLVICTCTAFIILFGGVPDASLSGIRLTQAALVSEIGPVGSVFVAVAIFLFAFSSIIGNYYYGEANIRFITRRPGALTLYRLLVGAMVLFGALATLDLAWSLADITMALMTLFNLAAILLLGRQAFLLLADYVAQKRQGIKNPVYTRDRIPELKDKAECW